MDEGAEGHDDIICDIRLYKPMGMFPYILPSISLFKKMSNL
jgi:hypothetical protein